MDEICHQKGVEHALDHICDSLNFVAVGIYWWLCGWWTHSYPAGHRHRRDPGTGFSGPKTIVADWPLFGGVRILKRRWSAGQERFSRILRTLQTDKIS